MRGRPTGGGSGPVYDFFGHHQTDTTFGNRIYPAGATNGTQTTSTFTPTANKLYAMPLSNPVATTVTRVGFELVSLATAGKKARMGVYTSTSRTDLYPDKLVVDAGEVPVDAGLGYKDIVLGTPVTLAASALYWLCWIWNGASTIRGLGAGQMYPVLGWLDTELSEYGAWGWRADHVYGVLPATFPVAGAEVNGKTTLLHRLLLFYGMY